MTRMSGWGRYPWHETTLLEPRSPGGAASALLAGRELIARGNGRSYGDAAVGRETTLSSRFLDRMRHFDPETGSLTVEAGVLLADIIRAFLPRGFFPPVVPGTKLVTVGGMIAADVHGKNHHREGGFGQFVERLRLALPSGETVDCSPSEHPDLFSATIGGMGLTGMILEATFRMKRVETGWMRQRTVVAKNLDVAMAALESGDAEAGHTVAWIDCLARGPHLGRSLVYSAEHVTRGEAEAKNRGEIFPRGRRKPFGVPMDMPRWALQRRSAAAFNEIYFRSGARSAGEPVLVDWDSYFFPLDGLEAWNRLYGADGLLQHQCVVPDQGARDVLGAILERVSAHGGGSPLAVLKRLGNGAGLMSFPFPGYTLAIDLRAQRDVFPMLDEIDAIVVRAGGRLYLAKDARQSRETFEAGYPALSQFQAIRAAIDPERRLASRLSERLGIS